MSVKLSKLQRRIILLTLVLGLLSIVLWRFTTVEPGGTYSVNLVPADNVDKSIPGEAEIIYEEDIDGGQYFLKEVQTNDGEKIYFYEQPQPIEFGKTNTLNDDEFNTWQIHIGERVDQLGFWGKFFVILPNVLYWFVIVCLFAFEGFLNDIIALLEVSKEDKSTFNRFDRLASRLGGRLKHWRDNVKYKNRLSYFCMFLGTVLAILWFFHQYKLF